MTRPRVGDRVAADHIDQAHGEIIEVTKEGFVIASDTHVYRGTPPYARAVVFVGWDEPYRVIQRNVHAYTREG